MTPDADIVVAGAGHNSLLAACYLAKAGYRCLVLDARHIPGGGAATEELVLPGFGIDTCATGHTMIRVNPALVADELGLVADYGLRYAEPDPVEHVAFPDGRQLTMWLDRERTIEEVARFSAADAASYRRLLEEYDEVKSIFSRSQFTPVGFGPSLEAMLAEHPRGGIWARRRLLSAVEVVRHEFTSRHIQAFLLWMAFQVFQPVDVPGSGVLPYQQTFGRQQRSWSIPIGGGRRGPPPPTRYPAPPRGAGAGGPPGPPPRAGGRRAARAGSRLPAPAWVLVAPPPLADPGRAPAGLHTVKALTPQTYRLPEGDWERVKERHARHLLGQLRRHAPNFTDEVILGELTKSPADIERMNPHMIHGAFHGGNPGPPFSGAPRPPPGWASHRMPIPGLYQTGGSTHPRGPIPRPPRRHPA